MGTDPDASARSTDDFVTDHATGQRVAEHTSPTAAPAVAQLGRRSRPVAAGLIHAVARRDQRDRQDPGPIRRMAANAASTITAKHGASLGSRFSLASALSYRSVLSVASAGSALSVGSLGSIGSAGSILSIGSAGSILSIGSTGSILTIGSTGSILSIGSVGIDDRAEATEARDAVFGQIPGLIACAAIAAAAWQAIRPTT